MWKSLQQANISKYKQIIIWYDNVKFTPPKNTVLELDLDAWMDVNFPVDLSKLLFNRN